MKFTVHNPETAPAKAKTMLAEMEKALGFVPNLYGVMAEAPALLKAYTTVSRIFEETSLTPAERQVVLLTASYENGCAYCVAAHSMVARMQNVPDAVVGAIRAGKPIPDAKLQALREFTSNLVETRGWPSQAATKAFLDAGYTKSQVLEVILGVGLKCLSNYTNHVAGTPLDAVFAGAAWSKPV